MLTVASLVEDLDLGFAAGADGADRAIRWVHISELDDPTPWLSGGELLLTTGINLRAAAAQRKLVRLLAEHELAGLGFGTGFDHERLPRALVEEARKRSFPLFEVPYEMPFIAITEKAFTQLVNEQYGVLERGLEVHGRLERLLLEERGMEEILASISQAATGSVLLLDAGGAEVGRHERGQRGIPDGCSQALGEEVAARAAAGRAVPFVPAALEGGRALAVPVPAAGRGHAQSWLVVVRRSGEVGDLERLLSRQAAMVVALEMMRHRAVRETERRLAGDVLAEALGGRLDRDELRGRLRPFGLEERAAVLVLELDHPGAGEGALEEALAAAGRPRLVAVTTASGRPLLCAVVDPGDRDPVELAAEARERVVARAGPARVAASRTCPVDSVRRSFHEARCALEATALADGEAPEVASHRDLGAFTLLLSIQDEEALRQYAENVLAPIENGEGAYGSELLRSLEAFIEENGQWERASKQLFCHRHTLRYRIRRIEDLTGRDLSHAQDRIEMWLALRARELVR